MPRFNPLKPNKTARATRPKPLPKGVVPSPEPVSPVPVLSENNARDGFELRFRSKPDAETLAKFHATRELQRDEQWHWHRRGCYWYARRNDQTRAFAAALLARITAGVHASAGPISAFPSPLPPLSPVKIAAVEQEHTEKMETLSPVEIPVPTPNIIPVNFVPVPDQIARWRVAMLRKPAPSNAQK